MCYTFKAKEIVLPISRSFNLFFSSIYNLTFNKRNFIIFFLILPDQSVYSILLAGWRGVSKFASLGEIRSCRQPVSYEVERPLFIAQQKIFFLFLEII